MRQMIMVVTVTLTLVGLVGGGRLDLGTSARESTPTAEGHPFIGAWIVDTMSESGTDSPEIAVVTADGRVAGLGADRVAGGRWEATDPRTAALTLVTVFDNEDGAGYVVIRGPHTVDASGDAWTCDCTFTVVGADGTVLDSGVAPASGRRLPLEGVDMAGKPLAEIQTWAPALAEATPAA